MGSESSAAVQAADQAAVDAVTGAGGDVPTPAPGAGVPAVPAPVFSDTPSEPQFRGVRGEQSPAR